MAYYAALVPLVQLLDDIIIHDRYPTFLLAKQPIMKSLHLKISFLEESLQDYSSKGDEASDRLEGRIRDMACRAQDVIESEISDLIVSEEQSREVITIPQADVELEKVGQDVDSIVDDLMLMKESCRNENVQPKDYSVATGMVEQTPTGVNTMVGMEEDLTSIKDQLCGQSSQLRIISIVGMGGIGKTTLARNIFDDALIVYYFYRRAWVSVSQDYHLNRVLQSILKSMGIATPELCGKNEEELKEYIYKSLKGERYLIVLDDIWNTNVWNDMKFIFPNDDNGSRILLTTRLTDVAHYASNFDLVHEMKFMDVNASWDLLQKKVFAQESCPLELEDVGKFIAGKCRGLPLTLVVMAGIISNIRTRQYWENVARNVGSFLSRDDNDLSNVFSLSYNNLSHMLKACFLYMGGFPEDYEINVSRLIRLWVAEGFLKSIDGSKTLEQVGEECVDNLVKRNLILITGKRANGQFKNCVLHDLVRDFCRQRATHECFFHEIDWTSYLYMLGASTARRVIPNSNTCRQHGEFGTPICLSTILWFGSCDYGILSQQDNYKLLKVLDICNSPLYFKSISDSWGFHLKYIALEVVDIPQEKKYCIHPSIFKLHNLETLIIRPSAIFALPFEFWQMPRIRHVIIDEMLLPAVPAMVGGVPVLLLKDLQTLGTVWDYKFTKETIQMIPNLRKLKILCVGYYNSEICEKGCIKLNHLVHLRQLVQLNLQIAVKMTRVQPFSSSLVFPQNLEKLSLTECRLPWNNLTVVGSLPCLQVLKLRQNALVGEEWEPIPGEFSQLKFLLIERLDLKCWRADDTHFPRLEHLKINRCTNLEEIPLEIGDIQTLKSIYVEDSELAGESAKRILEEQRSQGNDALRVLVSSGFITIRMILNYFAPRKKRILAVVDLIREEQES